MRIFSHVNKVYWVIAITEDKKKSVGVLNKRS